MLVEVNNGCFGTKITIDGVDWNELPNKKDVLILLIKNLPDDRLDYVMDSISWEFDNLIPEEDQFDTCDQCGNYNTRYQFKIETNING
jgi:hypothetical protein